ncbi:hypothetical protein BDM02DRAFT_1459970 [Thelephora ganbajun]|uniref:Uncharacterized protein n=1 Tax=Thelephora ganbajun TaxID=370292 RepID=A0ACB6ZLP6_THEGA|nr:hypothetical protein BDM02DRAFT_1459970 [Thelephora ganbajun]
MVMDVAALRSEIKAWERDFKADNGRDPTIQDIKDQPDVAEKYKLYKRLNKAKTQPSTPPKRGQKQLISKSQAVKTEPSVVSTNPFSPVKNKGSRVLRVEQTRPISNPFSTPRKEAQRELSPDPFPLIQPVASSSQVTLPPQPTSAVSRARKRLRGEPVSPSPVKPKRPRVIPSGGPIPFPERRPFDSDEEYAYSDDGFDNPSGPALFEETPRKDRSGSKYFTSLFNEDDRMTQPNFSPAITQSRSAPRKTAGPGFFTRTRSQSAGLSLSDEDDGNGSARTFPRAQVQTQPRTRQKLKPFDARVDRRANAFSISSRLTSSRGNNLLDQDSRALRSVSISATSGPKSNASTTPPTPDHGVSKLPPTSSAPTSDAEMDSDSDSIKGAKARGKNKEN